MRTTLLVAAMFAGCGTYQETVCGQHLDERSAAWLTLEDLQSAETAFIGGVLLVSGDARVSTPGEACRWLHGVSVLALPESTFKDDWGRDVSGIALAGKDWTLTQHAPGGAVTVGRQAEGTWRSSALVHEWLHIVEGGIPATPCARTDDPHCGWSRPGGEYALIDALAL